MTWPHQAIYFGTWQQAGHFGFLPGMKPIPFEDRSDLTPWGNSDQLDHAPKWNVGRSRYSGDFGKQGDAVLRHKDGWTWLAVADYSVDHRGNSHASFVLLGTLAFDEAVEAARLYFPEVVDRVGEIRERPDGV